MLNLVMFSEQDEIVTIYYNVITNKISPFSFFLPLTSATDIAANNNYFGCDN